MSFTHDPILALQDFFADLHPNGSIKVGGDSYNVVISMPRYDAVEVVKALDRLTATQVAREDTPPTP